MVLLLGAYGKNFKYNMYSVSDAILASQALKSNTSGQIKSCNCTNTENTQTCKMTDVVHPFQQVGERGKYS